MPSLGVSKTIFSNQMLFKVSTQMVTLNSLKLLIENIDFFNCVYGSKNSVLKATPSLSQSQILLNKSHVEKGTPLAKLVHDWQNFYVLFNHIEETRPDIFSLKSGASKMAEMTKASKCSRAKIENDVLKKILIVDLYLNELSVMSEGQGTPFDQETINRFLENIRQQVTIREYL